MEKNLKNIYVNIFDIQPGKRKSSFSKIFFEYKEQDFKKKIDLLYDAYYSDMGSYKYDAEAYAETTKNVVSSYTNNKDSLIAVYKSFNEYISKQYGIEMTIKYPPIPIANSFERLMFIAKYLQDENHLVSDLPDVLWQSQRTIEADLAKLQGNDGDPLQVCGREFIINEMDRSMGHISFGSTAHPFFLTANLTQVITMLEGLKQMAEKPEYAGYAMPMAKNIWEQLSDYGKNRIFYVMNNLLGQGTEWYESLNERDKYSYHTELECCSFGDNALMYCLKSDEKRDCYIEYASADGTEFLKNVKIVRYSGNGWTVTVDGEERVLESSRIIRSSYHQENMY